MTPAARRILLLLLAVSVVACGKKGPPRPPLPPIPAEGPPLEVRQAGGLIEVRIPLPARMVDGTAVPGFTGLRLERVVQSVGPDGAPRAVHRRQFDGAPAALELMADDGAIGVLPAPGQVYLHQEEVDAALDGPGPAAVSYAARFLVRRRWSPPTPAVTLVPGEAPPAPSGFQAEATGDGARLSWSPVGEGIQGTAVYRSRPGQPFPFHPMTVVAAGESGFLDPTAAQGPGQVYTYEIRAVLGEGARRRLSAPAGPQAVDMTDRFPPATPRGLTALARPGGVDLFWVPSDEGDLGGYRVYRRELPDGDWQLLTPAGVQKTAWSDLEAAAGRRYAYAISAVDQADPPNESERSVPSEITVPQAAPPPQEAPVPEETGETGLEQPDTPPAGERP